jgi:hypothetical protein
MDINYIVYSQREKLFWEKESPGRLTPSEATKFAQAISCAHPDRYVKIVRAVTMEEDVSVMYPTITEGGS